MYLIFNIAVVMRFFFHFNYSFISSRQFYLCADFRARGPKPIRRGQTREMAGADMDMEEKP